MHILFKYRSYVNTSLAKAEPYYVDWHIFSLSTIELAIKLASVHVDLQNLC